MANGVGNPAIGLKGQLRRGSAPLIATLAILAAALIWFFGKRLHYMTDYSPASYSDYFWPRRIGLLLHMSGGAVAISTGLVQLWLGLTGQTRGLHRMLGRIYVCAIVVGVVGAAYLVATVPGHLPYRAGLGGLATAWTVTTAMAVLAIRRKDIVQHRAWMLRSYTVTFAFVTYRIVADTFGGSFGPPDAQGFTDLDTIMAWACWAVPLLAMEVFIQSRAMRPRIAT